MKKSTFVILTLFGLSVSLNLFIAGFYLGDRLNAPKKQRRLEQQKVPSPSISMRQLVSKLPEEKRRLAKPYLTQHKKVIRKTVRQHIKTRFKLYRLLRSETLDVPEIKEVISKERSLKHQIDLISTDAFVDLLPKLTYEERLDFIDSLMDERKRDFRHKLKIHSLKENE